MLYWINPHLHCERLSETKHILGGEGVGLPHQSTVVINDLTAVVGRACLFIALTREGDAHVVDGGSGVELHPAAHRSRRLGIAHIGHGVVYDKRLVAAVGSIGHHSVVVVSARLGGVVGVGVG